MRTCLGLHVRQQSERDGLIQERVAKLVALSLLPRDQNALAGIVGQAHPRSGSATTISRKIGGISRRLNSPMNL
jgi:hypothetical protein